MAQSSRRSRLFVSPPIYVYFFRYHREERGIKGSNPACVTPNLVRYLSNMCRQAVVGSRFRLAYLLYAHRQCWSVWKTGFATIFPATSRLTLELHSRFSSKIAGPPFSSYHGTGRAADYLGRSAKLVEADDEKSAVDRYLHAAKVMVPPGSDSRTNFVRVVGGCEVLLQGIRFLASTNRLDECMQVYYWIVYWTPNVGLEASGGFVTDIGGEYLAGDISLYPHGVSNSICSTVIHAVQVIERYCIILLAEGIEHSLARMYLTYCVVALANGDYVKAESAFRNEHLQSTA